MVSGCGEPAFACLERGGFDPLMWGRPAHPDGGLSPSVQGMRMNLSTADAHIMDAAEREEILTRYLGHARRFDEVAARRNRLQPVPTQGEVLPLAPPVRRLEQEPTPRESQVLQLISDGLVNREIGERLFLSEETVKSHVRHLLAKLQARSRAHAVAIGFRRGLIQ